MAAPTQQQTQALRGIVERSERLVFFGGAGVSTESGIPDFRSTQGLYNQSTGMTYPPEVILSHSFFRDHTDEFYFHYKAFKAPLVSPQVAPNPAHHALVAWEKQGKLAALITQNTDGLHHRAGSKNVLELHGSAHRNSCLGCQKEYGLDFLLSAEGIPTCDECGEIVRPGVVLYEEGLDPAVMIEAARQLRAADTLIISGTSLVVYPAAGLVHDFGGDTLVVINNEPTPTDSRATLAIHAPVGETLSIFI